MLGVYALRKKKKRRFESFSRARLPEQRAGRLSSFPSLLLSVPSSSLRQSGCVGTDKVKLLLAHIWAAI